MEPHIWLVVALNFVLFVIAVLLFLRRNHVFIKCRGALLLIIQICSAAIGGTLCIFCILNNFNVLNHSIDFFRRYCFLSPCFMWYVAISIDFSSWIDTSLIDYLYYTYIIIYSCGGLPSMFRLGRYCISYHISVLRVCAFHSTLHEYIKKEVRKEIRKKYTKEWI